MRTAVFAGACAVFLIGGTAMALHLENGWGLMGFLAWLLGGAVLIDKLIRPWTKQ